MNKEKIIQQYFQRKQFLTTKNITYCKHLIAFFNFLRHADHTEQDSTTTNLKLTGNGTADIITKQTGIISGIEEVVYLFHEFTNLKLDKKIDDGSHVASGTIVISVSGKNTELLAYERILLNMLGRMSGIATNCRDTIHHLSTKNLFNPPMIAATRKTPWMLLDKKAVAVGGGLTHRLHLSDWPMMKDNHLKVLQHILKKSVEETIMEAVKKMMIQAPFFEIEVETIQQANAAIQTFSNAKHNREIYMALLLDNFTPETARQVIRSNAIRHLKVDSTSEVNRVSTDIIIEASGGISEKNLSTWAETDVDIISLGSLTHSAPNFDLSMTFL